MLITIIRDTLLQTQGHYRYGMAIDVAATGALYAYHFRLRAAIADAIDALFADAAMIRSSRHADVAYFCHVDIFSLPCHATPPRHISCLPLPIAAIFAMPIRQRRQDAIAITRCLLRCCRHVYATILFTPIRRRYAAAYAMRAMLAFYVAAATLPAALFSHTLMPALPLRCHAALRLRRCYVVYASDDAFAAMR